MLDLGSHWRRYIANDKTYKSSESSTLDFMHAIFYQKCWNMIGKPICHTVKAFCLHGHLLRELNKIHITSIPKKGEFRNEF